MILSASCAPGLEPILSRELKHYGIDKQSRNAGRIEFELEATGLAKLLVNLRTADNLFWVFAEFPAADFDSLFDAVYDLPWEQVVDRTGSIIVEKVRSRDSAIDSQSTVQSMVQKAAYTRLCEHYKVQRMPCTGSETKLRAHLFRNTCTLELDLCGMPLSKRGYRKFPGLAPLRESIAAASLFNAGWKASMPLQDIFCGTGSIAIEAALYAMHRAPGLKRSFAWEHFPLYDGNSVREAKVKAESSVRSDAEFFIAASDIDPVMIQQAKQNARFAEIPLSDSPDKPGLCLRAASFETEKPLFDTGFMITDPPYGNRLTTPEEALELYESLRKYFTDNCAGYDISVFNDKENFGELMQAKHTKKTRITDGKETRWLTRWIQQ